MLKALRCSFRHCCLSLRAVAIGFKATGVSKLDGLVQKTVLQGWNQGRTLPKRTKGLKPVKPCAAASGTFGNAAKHCFYTVSKLLDCTFPEGWKITVAVSQKNFGLQVLQVEG